MARVSPVFGRFVKSDALPVMIVIWMLRSMCPKQISRIAVRAEGWRAEVRIKQGWSLVTDREIPVRQRQR